MANLSSVITQTVGSSTAGVNLITAPNQGSIWTATTVSVATTTTAAELPLGPSISQAAKFSLAGSTGSAYVDFDMPSSLLNTKLQLAWYARASVTTIGTITASLASFASAANRTSNTSPTAVTLQTSSVQSAAPSFQTTFDSNSQGFYRLTLNFPAASGQWYSLCQLQVGPGTTVQGAAVSEWQSYTPASYQGFGTPSNVFLQYRRVGSSMQIQGRFLAGTTTAAEARVALPSGFTVATPGGVTIPVGQTSADIGATNYPVILAENGASYVTFGRIYLTSNVYSKLNGSDFTISGSLVSFHSCFIPIAEWSGSGTVNLGQGAQVEYASNDGSGGTTANTQYATGSVAGPAGSAFVAVASTTVTGGEATDYVVNFQYPIQSDDVLSLQILWSGNTEWVDISGGVVCDGLRQSNASYGMSIVPRSSTSVWVRFGNGGRLSTNGYGTAGAAWSALTSYKWRVRKAKASAPVGFGMAGTDGSAGLYKAGQAPGLTTGTAISAGYVGEIKTASMAANSTSNMATYIDNTLSLSLDGGVWHIVFQSSGYISHPNTGQTTLGARIYNVTDASNLTFIDFIGLRTNPVDSADSFNHTYHLTGVVNIPLGQTKVFKGQIVCGGVAGSPTAGGVGCRNTGSFYAVRIA